MQISPCTHHPAWRQLLLAGCEAGRRSPFLHLSPLLPVVLNMQEFQEQGTK